MSPWKPQENRKLWYHCKQLKVIRVQWAIKLWELRSSSRLSRCLHIIKRRRRPGLRKTKASHVQSGTRDPTCPTSRAAFPEPKCAKLKGRTGFREGKTLPWQTQRSMEREQRTRDRGGGLGKARKDPQATWGAGCVVHMFLKRMHMALTLYGIYPNTSWSHLPKAVMSFRINQMQNQHSRNKHTLRVMGELAVGAGRCRGESVFNYVNSWKFENLLEHSSSWNPTRSFWRTSTSGLDLYCNLYAYMIWNVSACVEVLASRWLMTHAEALTITFSAQFYQFVLNGRISPLLNRDATISRTLI